MRNSKTILDIIWAMLILTIIIVLWTSDTFRSISDNRTLFFAYLNLLVLIIVLILQVRRIIKRINTDN